MAHRKYHFSETMDRAIREAYASPDICRKRGQSPLSALPQRLHVPQHTIYRRALELGVVTPNMRKEPRWTSAEDAIVAANAHLPAHRIAEKLRRAGYARTPNAANIRRNRNVGIGRTEAREDRGLLKTSEAARLLGMSTAKPLLAWIRQGVLPGVLDQQETDRSDGRISAYLVKQSDLKELLIHYTAHFNFARIDKFWLVDLLTGKSVMKRDVT